MDLPLITKALIRRVGLGRYRPQTTRVRTLTPSGEAGHIRCDGIGGLNNQVHCWLAGLFLARFFELPLALPDVQSPLTAFNELFDAVLFSKGLSHFVDVRLKEEAPGRPWSIHGNDLWDLSEAMLTWQRFRDLALEENGLEEACIKALAPVPRLAAKVATTLAALDDGKPWACLQLRIEEDWLAYARTKTKVPGRTLADVYVPVSAFLRKLAATPELADVQKFYVIGYKSGDTMDQTAEPDTQPRLTGLMEGRRYLDRSVLGLEWERWASAVEDFEIAVQAPIFIGHSQSSFSNRVEKHRMVCSRPPGWIYNAPVERLLVRKDAGLHYEPLRAASGSVIPFVRRETIPMKALIQALS